MIPYNIFEVKPISNNKICNYLIRENIYKHLLTFNLPTGKTQVELINDVSLLK